MSWHNKVVWSEGLFLRPQHLQQHDRYLERLIDARSGGAQAYGCGVQTLEIDRDLLSLGKFSLARCRGVLPDGTPFNLPDDDPPPVPLEPGTDVHGQIVYLALPVRQPGTAEAVHETEATGMNRYRAEAFDVRDNNAGMNTTASVAVGRLCLRLMLEQEDRSSYACIAVANIAESRADKQIILDEQFMPTSLDYKAAPRLAGFMTELRGLLRYRAESLAGRISESGRGGAAEIADFMLLQAVNRMEPLIAHLCNLRGQHPERVYREFVQIAGELATFTAKDKRAPEFPDYQHNDLRATFGPVIAALRQSLSMVMEQNAIPIPLQERKFGIRVAPIADHKLLQSAVFVLAVNADVPNDTLRSRFPTQIKIGPTEQIRQLVNLQLPGIGLRPLPVAPRQIPYHAGFTYFELDRSSQFWKQLDSSGGFAMHIAGNFPGLELEFWAIKG